MLAEIERLIVSLSGADMVQARNAAEELAGLGEESQGAATALVDASRSDDAEVCQWAVAALEQMGPPRAEDVDKLISQVDGVNELADYWAVTLLGRLGPQAASAAQCLGQTLEHSSYPGVCQRAAWALRELGPSADRAKAALERAAKSSDPRLVRLAQEALAQLAG